MVLKLVQLGLIFGLLSLSNALYPHEKFTWLILMTIGLAFDWFILPGLERWIKKLVKQAIQEKRLEDDEYAQQQMLDDHATP